MDPIANPDLLIQQLKALIANPEAFSTQGTEIIQLSRQAAVALEGPFETFQRLAYSALPLVSARIAQEHNIFQTLIASDDPTSVTVLSEKTKINPVVLDILLDYLSTQFMVEEVSPQHYKATKLSNILVAPLFIDGVLHFHDNCLPAFNALNYSLAHPADPRTPFEIGHDSPVDFYTYLESHPVQGAAFHRFMEAQFASLPTWLDVLPFDSEYAASATPETLIFVDVGGGNGQQCVALQKKYPDLQGRIVLQDRPAILEKAITPDSARAYYFRQIFHNNNDETCHLILAAHLPALSPSSVILIDDKVLPDAKPATGSVEYTAGLSLAMKAMFNALERREGQWRSLLADAGLEIREIRRYTDFGDSVIVAGWKV
ncbi:hypothetical protein VF21_01729 [Pseudogymnoascus sp. 05NY08]|nr:hypothetical protein VF21_01729 [Pseudogymnoascus sp. 05NY08]